MISGNHAQIIVSDRESSKDMIVVPFVEKEEGECTLFSIIPTVVLSVNTVTDEREGTFCENDKDCASLAKPNVEGDVHSMDAIAIEDATIVEHELCRDDFSPISTINSLASKAKDSLEKKLGKAGKNKKTSGGKKGRKSNSPHGGRRN